MLLQFLVYKTKKKKALSSSSCVVFAQKKRARRKNIILLHYCSSYSMILEGKEKHLLRGSSNMEGARDVAKSSSNTSVLNSVISLMIALCAIQASCSIVITHFVLNMRSSLLSWELWDHTHSILLYLALDVA